MSLKLIATITTNETAFEEIKHNALALLAPTRLEDGCLQYELFQDHETPYTLIFIEEWRSEEALQKHLSTTHLQAFFKCVENRAELSLTKAHRLG